jgi:hypothetical protein
LATDPEARVRYPTLPEKKVVGLERGPLSLVSTTEELLDRKIAAPVYKTENTAVGIRHADHVAPSIRKKLAITSQNEHFVYMAYLYLLMVVWVVLQVFWPANPSASW